MKFCGLVPWWLVLLLAPGDEPTVWVFLSPDGPDATPIFRQLEGRRVRTVLLVERYFGNREPSEAFLATVQVAGELRAFDEEGLKMARRLNIRRVPAVAVVRDDHAHLATGTKVNVQELLRCSR
jgi:hypothetical protein